MSNAEQQLHYSTCTLCEAMCGIEVATKGRQILSIKGDKENPFSQGHICPKASALKDLYDDPDRLKRPVKRGLDELTAKTAPGKRLRGMKPLIWSQASYTTSSRPTAIMR